MLMYERIFQILQNKIECGLLPAGTSLPSRADLCVEFGTSEKTIRRVLAMLEKKGMIETSQRKRAVISTNQTIVHKTTMRALEKIDTVITNDVLKTGVLLCYPLIKNGISLCEEEDLRIPRQMLENMKIGNASEFWKLSKRFWRFFIARNENDLSLRAVDVLGLSELQPVQEDIETRTKYYEKLQEFMKTIEDGGAPESVHFDDMSKIYGISNETHPVLRVASDFAGTLGKKQPIERLSGADIRYSAVYMDILGLIATGYYPRGTQLPTHKELQKIYGVSVDTTVKAIQILQEWGVVKTVRGSGIYVEMDLNDLKKVQIQPKLIACHVRRYLDSLELLTLTIEGVAASSAAHIMPEDIQVLQTVIDRLWNEDYLYERTPAVLLDFITEHVEIDALSAIYELLRRNFRIGRSIPALLNINKTAVNTEVHEQCVEALNELTHRDHRGFSEKTAQLFENIHNLVIEECRRLGYYEAAMGVYDGAALWR